MNCQEFRNNFDLLYNNLSSNAAPGLDDYEISLLLTKAQEELVKNKILALGNRYQIGIEGNSKRQVDLSTLIERKSYTITFPSTLTTDTENNPSFPNNLIVLPDTYIEDMKNEMMYVLQRFIGPCKELGWVNVIPMTHDEFVRMKSRPFGEPMKRQAWEVLAIKPYIYVNTNDVNKLIKLKGESQSTIIPYTVEYVRRPKPIILTNLDETEKIDGINTETECELPKEMHQEILQRAVELAKAEYMTNNEDLTNQINIGQRSE